MASLTSNFRLVLPTFDATSGWDQDLASNFAAIDALMAKYFAVNNLQGNWRNSTLYTVGQVVVDPSVGALYTCGVGHTSAASPTTFLADRTAHPTFWSNTTFPAAGRGAWGAGITYYPGNFVTVGNQYAVCNVQHVSSTFAGDTSAGYWSIIADFTAPIAQAQTLADSTQSIINTQNTNIGTANTNASNAVSTANGISAVATRADQRRPGYRNRIHNGTANVTQRAFAGFPSTASTNGGYGTDRWRLNFVGTGTTATLGPVSANDAIRAAIGDESVQTLLQLAWAGQSAVGDYVTVSQFIEDVFSLAGKTVTLSFWCNASYTGNVAVELVQTFGSVGSPSADVSAAVATIAVANGWAYRTVTLTLPSIAAKTFGTGNAHGTWLQVYASAGSNFNARTNTLGIRASGTFNMTQVQLEVGSVATPFEYRPQDDEVRLCRRFLYVNQFQINGATPYPSVGTTAPWPFPVPMWKTPSAFLIGTSAGNLDSLTVTPTSSLAGFVYAIQSAAGSWFGAGWVAMVAEP